MPIPYIWFGDNSIVDINTGKLKELPLNNGSDKWTVVALLGWDQQNTQKFTPALLIHKDNPVLRTLLQLLDDAATSTLEVDKWRVIDLPTLTVQLPDQSTVTFADPPQTGHQFLRHKAVAETELTAAQNTPITIAGVLTLKSVIAKVLADSTPSAKLTLAVEIQDVDLRRVGFKTPFTIGKTIKLSYSTVDKKLKLNDKVLDSDPGTNGTTLDNDFSLVVDDSKVGLDIAVPSGDYTYQPLVSGIPGSKVDFKWKSFRIRLHQGELGLAAVPGAAGPGDPDDLGTATFTLPLIQAAVGESTTNALAKLVPTNSQALTPLTFTVTLKRPDGSVDVSPLVYWTVKLTENAGKFADEVVNKLRGVFHDSDSNSDTELTSFFAPLQELAGKAGDALYFKLSHVKSLLTDGSDQTPLINALRALDAFNTENYELPLALKIGKNAGKPDLIFLVVLHINLWKGRLSSNRAYFYVASGTERQILDLSAFAMTLPARSIPELIDILGKSDGEPPKGLPNANQHDGYVDFEALDVVLDAQPVSQPNRPQLAVLFPGDLKKDNDDGSDEDKRVRILLEDFEPEVWPEQPKDKSKTLQLRLGARGLTFSAKADTVKEAKITVAGNATVPMRLVETRDGLRSGLVVIDNQVRYANLAGRIEIPGLDNFEADVALGLRRDKPNEPPVVTAVIDIDRTDRKPLARMKVPLLKAQLDDLRMQLTWTKKPGNDKPDWDFRAWATGAISITGDVGSTGGIEGLDQPQAIPFRDLDLTRLHRGAGQIPLGRPVKADNGEQGNGGPSDSTPSTVDQVARFELLEKQFRIEFYNSVLHWDLDAKTARFEIKRARFEYQASSGDLDVAIEAGEVKLHFDGNKRSLKFETPSSFGLQVRIGTQLSFAGNVGWEDTPTENYFRADGRLQMTGFPEVAGSLKLGTGIKDDGKTAPNLAIFAELPYEADLFSGVVLKRVGLGLGLNNRLAGIGDRPDPRAILANLDRIDPKQSRNWSFVSESGVYVSVVATAMIASNRGKDNVVCAYVAKLLLSIDTNIDIVAAAQVWLFSSPGYITQQDHERRPALIGAAVLSARERTFSLVAQTTPRPAIQSNQMLSDLLSRVQARFSFYLSSDLADFYLEELSYRDQLFGINVAVIGSYRIAIGRFGALMRATLGLRGELPEKKLQGGIGGFSFRGNFGLDADFGGLVSSRGLAAYGSIRVGISFRVSAFVNIPTVAFETIEYEQTFSITISIPYLKCKRWKCKWKRRDITKTVTVRIKLVYPVFSIEQYHLPESSLDLVLEGILAFDESGGIGFSGRMAISTSVCGHDLRISPRFDYRPEVATNVRRRIAAVEDQINRLRGLPRAPVQTLPANTENELPPVETWYYYKSINGDEVYHLLVPSPEYPSWWYTPYATGMSQYANLPRDTSANASGQSKGEGIASEFEKRHLSPFRNAVMRMVLPFKDANDAIAKVVDLAMPWDRGNYDSLPGEAGDQTLVDLVMKLTQIESAFLNTAAKADSETGEKEAWEAQEDPGVALTDVEIVSDPRPESSARVYWTLTDQMTRPDGVYPYRYRPVHELVSEGFSGVSRRGDIGRLLRYDQVSRRAVTQGRLEDAAPRAARRLKNARATLLSTILADFTREQASIRYRPLDVVRLVREDEDDAKTPVVTRRRFAIPVTRTGTGASAKFVVNLTYAILENNTDLDLGLDSNNQAVFSLKWRLNENAPEQTDTITLDKVPASDDHNARHKALKTIELGPGDSEELHYKPFRIDIERTTPNTADAQGAPTKAVLQFITVPSKVTSQVGLVAVTSKDEVLDLANVRVFRNESSSVSVTEPPANWTRSVPVRIIPMTDGVGSADSIEAVQRWVRCLPPCQEFLSNGRNGENTESARVRVRLPVKFDEQILKAEIPRLNGFEIYRRFPWDPQPVKIAEGVPPVLRRVEENDRQVLLVESFLFGEDFEFDRETGRFTGIASAVIPGVTPIEYSLRAVPFGRVATNGRTTFRRWPAVTLHVPPVEQQLPALGLVVPVESLFEKKENGQSVWKKIPIHLVDSRHSTWDWLEKSWDEFEIWAEPQRIRSSGSYAVEGEPPEVDAQAAARQTVREPGDLTVERIPESVSGKILVARLQRPKSPEMPNWNLTAGSTEPEEGLTSLQPGFGYRFFVRPAVSTQSPLVQPLALHLIRELPSRMDEATPVLHVDRLELIEHTEIVRVMMPMTNGGTPGENAWLRGSDFRIVRRTEDNDPYERLRIAWDHLSDLDAGVEILLQDVDEPHRVDRQLVAAQEEAVFQTAIQDFRNPALWRAFPNRRSFEPRPLTDLTGVNSQTTREQDRLYMFLWVHRNNETLARVEKARNKLSGQLEAYAPGDEKAPNWQTLHPVLAEYLAALLAHQRTPLAPATPEDREALELLINLSQALLLGLRISGDSDLKAGKFADMRTKMDENERKLRRLLHDIESIDLSKIEVNDSAAAYDQLKLQLHDIDIAKQLAGIASRRLAIAEDLLDLTASDEMLMADDSESGQLPRPVEPLPRFSDWQTLDQRYRNIFLIPFSGFFPDGTGSKITITTPQPHGLLQGELVELNGITSLANRQFAVTLGTSTTFDVLLPEPNPTIPTTTGTIVRTAGQNSRALLDLFEPPGNGNTAARMVREMSFPTSEGDTLTPPPPFREPFLLIQPEVQNDSSELKAQKKAYREEVAKLVPLVAGVVAGLDSLKSDAKANDWTLIRRPHHHLSVTENEEGREAVPEPLSLYLPDRIGGPNLREDRPDLTVETAKALETDVGLIVPFVNLLERLGCAIDIAVVDALNQPLSQARLLDWVAKQPWQAILASVKNPGSTEAIPHEVVLISGREPDTDREMQSSSESTGQRQDEDRSLGYAFVKLAVVPRSLLTDIVKESGSGDTVNAELRNWLQLRSLSNAPATTPPVTAAEAVAIREMAKAWWKSISFLPGASEHDPKIGHCIVETRGRRWATVPVLGGRAHIDWTATDAAGRQLEIAVRRVSRYEGLLRWAHGTAVPILPRIHGLTTKETQIVSLRRRMVAGEEPKSLPVLISPHPTRIEFIYSLPTSGARATVSGLSARRTGYQGITAQFVHKRIDLPKEVKVTDLIKGISDFASLLTIIVTDTSDPKKWAITGTELANVQRIVVFDSNGQRVALGTYTPIAPNSTTGVLAFSDTELGDFPVPANNATIKVLPDPHRSVFAQDAVIGSIVRVDQTGFRFDRALNNTSIAMSEDPVAYTGQLLLIQNQSGPISARLIESYVPSNQSGKLTSAIPVTGTTHSVMILAGISTPRLTPVARSTTGLPNLFRHERLFSLPHLPYYRKFAVHVAPKFDGTDLAGAANEPVETTTQFAERKPSIMAVFRPTLSRTKSTTELTYSFRVFISRQGDLLTPAEVQTARDLDAASDGDPSLVLRNGANPRILSGSELPDLNCTYQILWELPDSTEANPVYAELVELLLPGSPQYSGEPDIAKPIVIQNRNKDVEVVGGDKAAIKLWWPSQIARPVYVVMFDVKVKVSEGGNPTPAAIFKDPLDGENPGMPWLQMQRDGYRTRPVKFKSFDTQSQ